jgi:hypothetical protein
LSLWFIHNMSSESVLKNCYENVLIIVLGVWYGQINSSSTDAGTSTWFVICIPHKKTHLVLTQVQHLLMWQRKQDYELKKISATYIYYIINTLLIHMSLYIQNIKSAFFTLHCCRFKLIVVSRIYTLMLSKSSA